MNRLLRGAEISRCCLRASRQAFSSSESAPAIGAQNLMAQTAPPNRRSRPVTSMPIASRPVGDTRFLRIDNIVLHNNFSSVSAKTKDETDEGVDGDDQVQQATPSFLERACLEKATPGHCMFVLQNFASNRAVNIWQEDFVTLCESARPGKMKDGKVISYALRDFKRINKFVLKVSGCRAAMEGMLRAMIPTWKVQDGRPRVRAAIFVAEQILDETTGLYFAVETVLVDKVLEELQRGLLDMEKNGFELRVDDVGEDAEAEGEPSADEKMLRDALRVTGELVRFLIKRKSRPHLKYKKRARRAYLKKLAFSGGPYASTMQLATHISILIGGSAVVQESIITPWEEAWWTKHKTVDPAVLHMIEVASARELELKKSAEAAAEAEGGEDVESEESNEDAGGEEGVGEEGNA